MRWILCWIMLGWASVGLLAAYETWRYWKSDVTWYKVWLVVAGPIGLVATVVSLAWGEFARWRRRRGGVA